MNDSYLGNKLLRAEGIEVDYTPEQIQEIAKCKKDPFYFIENYYKIISLDDGLVPLKLRDYQVDMIDHILGNRMCVIKTIRQVGKSTVAAAAILHMIIFNDYQSIAILANKNATAKEILSRIKNAYQNLPKWMQHGVTTWNKQDIGLENGSRIIAAATGSDAIRGFSFNTILLDEFAFVPTGVAEDFFSSVYPTISSGKKTRLIIVSTPVDYNHFYKLWNDAVEKRNNFAPFDLPPERARTREELEKFSRDMSEDAFRREFSGEFITASNTLIAPSILKALAYNEPTSRIKYEGDRFEVLVYKIPEEKNEYIITVDVGEGIGGDFTTFSVFNITQLPYEQVATFRSNLINSTMFSHILHDIAKSYNEASILIETNEGVGEECGKILFEEFEYSNIITTKLKGRSGQIPLLSVSRNSRSHGVRMTKAVKRIGCTNLKELIENQKLILHDWETVSEITKFVRSRGSFAAEAPNHDDMVMTLVIFGWLCNQKLFKELSDTHVKRDILDEMEKRREESVSFVGFFPTKRENPNQHRPHILETPLFFR